MMPVRVATLVACVAIPIALSASWVASAKRRLAEAEQAPAEQQQAVAVAAASNEAYCTPELKKVLRRVLTSCGLIGRGSSRGCQPLEAKNVATLAGNDFNALFLPMKDRGGIIQFEMGKAELDANARTLIDKVFTDQRGASYFFVVSRASPEGSVTTNRKLSQERAEAVMSHLQTTFKDPDLDKEVGLLWLGEEFAQLAADFCTWTRSGGLECKPEDINRSAFIAWIDCRL
jgi:outer membrane protein OmpA-like peptidoglycan-associated protein